MLSTEDGHQFYLLQIAINVIPIHILASPNTIFSAIEYRYKAQSSENCLKMLSDQKRQKNSGHHRLKF